MQENFPPSRLLGTVEYIFSLKLSYNFDSDKVHFYQIKSKIVTSDGFYAPRGKLLTGDHLKALASY